MLGPQARHLVRVPVHTRLAFRPLAFRASRTRNAPVLYLAFVRSYAARGRATKSPGETSTTVKRTPKRAKSAQTKSTTAKKTKSKSTAKKPAAKAKPKRVQTPESKERARLKLEKEKINSLKKAALSPPPLRRYTALNAFVQERAKNPDDSSSSSAKEIFQKLVTQEWKSISAADLEVGPHSR